MTDRYACALEYIRACRDSGRKGGAKVLRRWFSFYPIQGCRIYSGG